MVIHALIGLMVVTNNISDTLLLPIYDGMVVNESSTNVGLHNQPEVLIYPTNDFEVRSCSDGKVIAVRTELNERSTVVIQSDSLFFTYILDTLVVKKGDYVKKVQSIGKLSYTQVNGVPGKKSPLLLLVNTKDRMLDTRKCLVYK